MELYHLRQYQECLRTIFSSLWMNGSRLTVGILACATLLTACSDRLSEEGSLEGSAGKISLAGDIDQLAVTRVNDSGFCGGDVMGVYVVDYNGSEAGTLLTEGNRADNVQHTFDESANKWNPAYDIYWKDKHTHIDVYGYYPFGQPTDVNDYKMEVRRDQSKASENGTMGGYEASDFLWGKVEDVAPTTSVIRLSMHHRMANVRVTLTEGSGFASGEWTETEKTVLATSLVRRASINLSDGSVKADGDVEQTATVPSRSGDVWRAIVVPQTVKAGTTLFSITIGGQPFKFARDDDFTYVAGRMSNFTIRVDKQNGSGQYRLTLVGESITAWENDLVSHNGEAREYVVVNSTAGCLKDSIVAAHRDYAQLKNLKITGHIDARDFKFMREQMPALYALNLKEVLIDARDDNPAFAIPLQAFMQHKQLTLLLLPDKLTSIGDQAFGYTSLSGSLTIPEGVVSIGANAFNSCSSLTGKLSLPTTLKKIGGAAFAACKFSCELVLPQKLKSIGNGAFLLCDRLYGDLNLPSGLAELGEEAFDDCNNLTGSLVIPQGITKIPALCFRSCGFNGTLQLPDGVTEIGYCAFSGTPFKGELTLPTGLTKIGQEAFYFCQFSGTLHLPQHLTTLGDGAFYGDSRLTGVLEFPEGLESIGTHVFTNCSNIEGLVFPQSLETIGSEAFSYNSGIRSIVCKGEMPAYVYSSAFDGVPKDNFTLEVPESAVAQYQVATGWKDFKRISAHHELVCRPAVACALNNEHRQTLTLDAEGDWEVADKPDWCEVSPTSGSGKTELTLTIKALSQGSSSRTGQVTFRLKDKDYTGTCTVSQSDYTYAEDEWLTLQKAGKGSRGGINIVLLGDGYDATAIASGSYLQDIKQAAEYFFAIEPYKTYRDYFNVYTAMSLSQESGVGTVNTICRNRFNTTFTGGGAGLKADYDEIFSYVLNAPTVTKDNLKQTLVIIVPNSTDYGGITQMWSDGSAISICPKSTDAYPLDSRGVLQHEAGGHGFGKLADEYIYHNAFIDACSCSCCEHVDAVQTGKSWGWYDNISLTGKMNKVPWSHLIYDKHYSDLVDIYEGGIMHSRGVFRSEQNSCMNNDIPYYSTISRESIVKRIMSYAGESYSFEDFVSHDVREAVSTTTRANSGTALRNRHQMAPVIHRGSPLTMSKVARHR